VLRVHVSPDADPGRLATIDTVADPVRGSAETADA
jgi:hypothetical protein